MKHFDNPSHGQVSLDPRVRYSNSIKAFENEKRHLRMSDKDEEEWKRKRREKLKLLRSNKNS